MDINGLQIDGPTIDVMNVGNVDKKFEAFGFNVITIDGHDIDSIKGAIAKSKETKGSVWFKKYF